MKILILSEDYPNVNNIYANSFVHSRMQIYKKNQLDILVLSFKAKSSYIYEGINVISLDDYLKKYSKEIFQLVISHAPNLKHHLMFLRKFNDNFKKVIFFIHGHEVLKINEYYPRPYDFKVKNSVFRNIVQNMYDFLKLKVLNRFFRKILSQNRAAIIFVSQWMKDEFQKNVGLDEENLLNNSFIIHNNANNIFCEKSYKKSAEPLADFITIRPLDNPKYCIDIVANLAQSNPNLSFHVYGVGEYFSYNNKPENLTVFNKFISQKDIPELLNSYKAALMPTRLDSQGVMMCEMATYGIPVITSNIPVCKETLSGFNNVFFIENDVSIKQNLNNFIEEIDLSLKINKDKFSTVNTVLKEIDLIQHYLKSESEC